MRIKKGGRMISPTSLQNRFEVRVLFRALVNPRANEAHLLGGQRLGHGAHGSAFRWPTGGWSLAIGRRRIARPARCTGPAAGAWSTRLWGHGGFLIDAGNGQNERAFGAFAGDDDLAIFAAFEDAFEGIQAQFGFRLLVAMTTQARGLEDRLNIFG